LRNGFLNVEDRVVSPVYIIVCSLKFYAEYYAESTLVEFIHGRVHLLYLTVIV